MTEGIVQKTIRHWFSKQVFPNGQLSHEITWNDITELQQELIEAIKQEFDKDGIGYNADYYNKASLLKLIGDTK